MAYQVTCPDVMGMDCGCNYVARSNTMEELMADGVKHGKEVHGLTDEQMQDPGMAEMIKAAVREV